MAVTLYGSGNAIIQVIQYSNNAVSGFPSIGGWQDTLINTSSVPLTRTYASSKILIFADIKASNISSGGDAFYRLVRSDGTVIAPGADPTFGQLGWQTAGQTDSFSSVTLGMRYMDGLSLPAGGISYKIQVWPSLACMINARGYYYGITGSVSFPVSSQITLMEVAFE